MTKPRSPLALIIIDGWGYSEAREGNAIALANTPTWDALVGRYPGTLLNASGLAVAGLVRRRAREKNFVRSRQIVPRQVRFADRNFALRERG